MQHENDYQPGQYMPGTNSGHGHVWDGPDGMKARCGGYGLCSACRSDYEARMRAVGQQEIDKRNDPIGNATLKGMFCKHGHDTRQNTCSICTPQAAEDVDVTGAIKVADRKYRMVRDADWSISSADVLQVTLSMVLSKTIPRWPGATDDQLWEVANLLVNALDDTPRVTEDE